MRGLGVRGQLLLVGVIIASASALSSAWSAWSFHEVSHVVGDTLADSERTTNATAALTTALEREDDALLLVLADRARGDRALEAARAEVNAALARVDAILDGPGERQRSREITHAIDGYHAAGDDLIAHAKDGGRLAYHERVNPLLRRAVGVVASVRDDHFRSAQDVAEWARDRAQRSTTVVSALTAVSLVIALLVALFLARAIVLPIRSLGSAVEAMRVGDFDRRVSQTGARELRQLAEGFNRMAAEVGEFRRANIGEVIRVKETLEATLAALPDAVVVVDAEHGIAEANPRARALLRGAVPASIEPTLRAAQAGTRTENVDLRHAIEMDHEGRKHKFLARAVPIEGTTRGAVLVLSDVTELARFDEMRTELVAVASHELRTPLTTLRMTLLMLEEHAALFEERDRELVRTGLRGVEQLGDVVDEYLDLTRIEAGALRLHWDRVDLAVISRIAVERARPTCRADVTLTIEATSCVARADPARLRAVLSNLLSNAIKYTPPRGTITVRVESDPPRVIVEDTGPGVPSELRERIFEKFFRVEHHETKESGVHGAGIGLYIARQIAIAHGGSLVCEEREGGGARFVLSL